MLQHLKNLIDTKAAIMANGIFDFYYFNFRFKQQKFQNKCVL